MKISWAIVFIAAGCFATLPARAAIDLDPGMWQDTDTGDVNGAPSPPKVSTDCVKPEDAKNPVKAARASMKDFDAKQCSKYDVKESGNTVLLDLKCGDPKEGAIEVSVIWTIVDARHTTSVAKSVMAFGGQTITSNVKTESKWLASACNK